MSKKSLMEKLAAKKTKVMKFMDEELTLVMGTLQDHKEMSVLLDNPALSAEQQQEEQVKFVLSRALDKDTKKPMFTYEEFISAFSPEDAAEFLKTFMELYAPSTKELAKN